MRLILKYTDGDEYTYSCDILIPIEYDSEEALICDFEAALDESILNKIYYFNFLGEEFWTRNFYSAKSKEKFLPEIMNLDQWFELNKKLKI